MATTDVERSRRRRVLIADDEAMMRRFIRDALEGADYDTLEAEDGRAVMRIIESTPVDLVIIDVCMPEKDGLETIQALRKLRTNLKVVAISGAFDGLFLGAARAFGADAAFPKPFRPDELAACVGQLLAAG